MDEREGKSALDKATGWADRPVFVRGLIGALAIVGLLSVVASFIPAFRNPHPHFGGIEFPGFFAVWGFVAFMFIVLVGQHLRKIVGRNETYYDDRE